MLDFIHKYYSVIFCVLLASIIGLAFFLGYKQGSVKKQDSSIVFSCPNTVLDTLRIGSATTASAVSAVEDITSSSSAPAGKFMGSKNGTKYYTPGCPASNRIKSENVIWFESVQDATLQGYTKGSC